MSKSDQSGRPTEPDESESKRADSDSRSSCSLDVEWTTGQTGCPPTQVVPGLSPRPDGTNKSPLPDIAGWRAAEEYSRVLPRPFTLLMSGTTAKTSSTINRDNCLHSRKDKTCPGLFSRSRSSPCFLPCLYSNNHCMLVTGHSFVTMRREAGRLPTRFQLNSIFNGSTSYQLPVPRFPPRSGCDLMPRTNRLYWVI